MHTLTSGCEETAVGVAWRKHRTQCGQYQVQRKGAETSKRQGDIFQRREATSIQAGQLLHRERVQVVWQNTAPPMEGLSSKGGKLHEVQKKGPLLYSLPVHESSPHRHTAGAAGRRRGGLRVPRVSDSKHTLIDRVDRNTVL